MDDKTQLQRVISEEDVPLKWQPGHIVAGLYEVQSAASGGMGTVYFVKHLHWGITLAVKTLLSDRVREEAVVKRFIREAEIWVELGMHPHIATCYYVRMLGEMPHIFIEYVNGGSLKEWLRRREKREFVEILDIVIQISRGMVYIHEKEIIHRDLKPANCLLTKEGIAKITDLGLAKVREEAEEATKIRCNTTDGSISIAGGCFGTLEYMAPEQFIDARHVGKAADVYSFGVMLFEMVCGRKPFVMPEEMHQVAEAKFYKEAHLYESPPKPTSLRGDCPKALNDLLWKCLEKSSADRYSSFKEIEMELLDIYREITRGDYPRKRPDPLKLRSDALNNKAVSLLDLGYDEDAERYWKEALEADTSHLASKFNHGYYLWHKAKIDPYKDYYLTFLKPIENFHGNNPEYWYNLSLVCAEIGLVNTAKETAKKADSSGCEKESAKHLFETSSSLLRTFIGHTDNVLSIVISPDAKHVISGSRDKTIRITKIDDGKCIRVFKGISEVNSLSISHDGRYVIAGTLDKTIRLWETATGRCINVFKGHNGSVLSVTISRDDSKVVSGSEDKTIRVWNIGSGRELRAFEGHTSWVESVCVSLDGRFIVSGGRDGTLRKWKMEESRCLNIFKGHSGSVFSVAISRDGRNVVSGGEDKTLRLWDLETGKCLRVFEGHVGWVKSVCISHDNKYVISGSTDKTVRGWDVETGRCVRVFEGHTNEVSSVAISPDSRYIISGGKDSLFRLWELKTPNLFHYIISTPSSSEAIKERGEKIDLFIYEASSLMKEAKYPQAYALLKGARKVPGYEKDTQIQHLINVCGLKSGKRCGLNSAVCLKVLEGHTKVVNSVCISNDNRYILSGGGDNTVRLWDIETARCLEVLEGHTKAVNSVCISSDNRYILSGSGDNTVRLWERVTGKCKIFKGHTGVVRSVAVSLDNRYIVSGGWDKTLRLWEIGAGKCIKVFEGHSGFVRSVAISHDGRYVVSGGWDKTLRIWEVKTGKYRVCEGHSGWIESLSFIPHGKHVISGGEDKTIRSWELETGRCIRLLEDNAKISSVAISPDGRHVFSGGGDNTIRLWDIENGKCIRLLEGLSSPAISLAISLDSRYVVFGGEDKIIGLWELDWDWEFPEREALYVKEELSPDTRSVSIDETNIKDEVFDTKTIIKHETSQPYNDTRTLPIVDKL